MCPSDPISLNALTAAVQGQNHDPVVLQISVPRTRKALYNWDKKNFHAAGSVCLATARLKRQVRPAEEDQFASRLLRARAGGRFDEFDPGFSRICTICEYV